MSQRTNARMRRLSAVLIGGLLMISAVVIGQPASLEFREMRQLFPWADSHKPLSGINETTKSAEVWDTDEPNELLGWAVLKSAIVDNSEVSLLIGIRKKDGAISKVIVRGIDDLPEDFLAQFAGRKSSDSFEIAKTAEDALFIPRKIRPVRDRTELAEAIAQSVEEAVLALFTSLK
jgi:hypothetical protein